MKEKELKELKEQINHKIDMVLRQYDISGGKVYAPILLDFKEKLFSGSKELEKEALKGMKSLLSLRAWDGYDYSTNPDDFIDDFQNFDEWYFGFLEGFIKDVERYVSCSSDK